jgi:ParB family transcriptional regulator, chromosome partitioning protein
MIMATSKIHKAFNIDFTAPAQGRSIEVDSQSSKKKTETAPGFMADVLIAESNAIQENKDLKAKLETFDGSLPTRMIDPNLIIRSKWSNRLEQSYQNQDFTNLKTEIANSKGNIQPIKVRPLAGSPGMFEIVFGHRRHQACLETGNQVLAIIEDVNEESLFIEMDRENRQRADLRPYEQGVMYKRAIDEGMVTSH